MSVVSNANPPPSSENAKSEPSHTIVNTTATNDIVFRKRHFGFGFVMINAHAWRLQEIVVENFQAHCNADFLGKRRIQDSVLEQFKKEFPPDARFLQLIPVNGLYLSMTDDDVAKALAGSFAKLRLQERRRHRKAEKKERKAEKKAERKAKAANLRSHQSAIESSNLQSQPTNSNFHQIQQRSSPNNAIEYENSFESTYAIRSHANARRVSLMDPSESSSASEVIANAKLEAGEINEEPKTSTNTTGGVSPNHDYASLKEENEQLYEENEQLKEEMEQMRMNHAMEVGFMEGGAGNSTEQITRLKEELEKAHERIRELQRLQSAAKVEGNNVKEEGGEVKDE